MGCATGPDLKDVVEETRRLVEAVGVNPALSPAGVACLSDDLVDLQQSYSEMASAACDGTVRATEPGSVVLARSWIFDADARLFLELAGALVGYSFDEDDWNAVVTGAGHAEPAATTYPLVGRTMLTVILERLDDGGHWDVTVCGKPSHTMRTQLETVFGVLTREGRANR